jgi:hypothetical protein
LDPGLNKYLGGQKVGGKEILEELFPFNLRPTYLCRLAEQLAEEWKFGRAIGCLRLAFYLSRPPYVKKDNSFRLKVACMPIRHLRHHVYFQILETTLLDIFKVLSDMDSAQIETVINLKYDLVALLNEHGLFECASDCAKNLEDSMNQHIIKRFPVDKIGSIKRRIYQVALLDRNNFSLQRLLGELEEMSERNLKLKTSLSNTNVLRALARKDKKEIADCYEKISALCRKFAPEIEKFRKPGVGPSDLAEIFLYKAILALFVKPRKYNMIVEDSFAKSKYLFHDCHALITFQYPDFWEEVFKLLAIGLNSSHPLAQFVVKHYRTPLSNRIVEYAETIFKRINTMVVIPE